jgi:hypothetical protein
LDEVRIYREEREELIYSIRYMYCPLPRGDVMSIRLGSSFYATRKGAKGRVTANREEDR